MSDEEHSQIDDAEVHADSDPIEQNALSLSHMRDCLSILAKIDHGLKYAYTRFQAMDRNFTDISLLAKYRYIRYVDVSGNNLSDISCLKNLPNLLLLDAERNQLTEANLGPCPYLQILNLAQNRIKSTAEFEYPYLRHLNLNNNAIESLSGFDTFKCDGLRKLELRGNQLKTTANIALPKLEELYLAENQIAVIEGLETMTSLSILHLRGNPIQSLDGLSDKNKKLTYLNLRQTQVENMAEVEKLQVLSNQLRSLSFLDSPIAESENYRMETLILLRLLDRLDKEKFTSEERLEAQEVSEAKTEQNGDD